MYELIQAGENSFYMDCPTKVGFYRINEDEAVLIDSGSDKDAAKKVKKILDAQGWKLKAILNTHSHADHIGGNRYLWEQTGCEIYAPGIDCAFTEFPVLEPTVLYGGFIPKELENKFLMAKESPARPLIQACLPYGMELISLPGHSYDMVGFRTADDVVYLADCLSSAETLSKYKIGYLYDVQAYLDTLQKVKTMKADMFVPAHAPCTDDIGALAQVNIDATLEIAERVRACLRTRKTFEDLLAELFEVYGLTMTVQQHMLIGSTVKSYLSYLKRGGRVDWSIENNRMFWQACEA